MQRTNPKSSTARDVAASSQCSVVPIQPAVPALSKASAISQPTLPLPAKKVMRSSAINLAQGATLKPLLPQDAVYQPLVDVIAGSTWQTTNPDLKQKNATADVFSIFIRETGLPMAVLLDGCGHYAEHRAIACLGDELLVFADLCAQYVENNNPSQDEFTAWVKPRYRDLDRSLKFKAEFEASFSVVFLCRTKQQTLQLIGIGTGDTMVLIEENDEQMRTIIAACNIEGASPEHQPPLPFPCPDWGEANLDNTLAQLQIVMTPVKPDDSIIFLTDGAYECWPCDTHKVIANSTQFMYRTIKSHTWQTQQSAQALSHFIWQHSATTFATLKAQAALATYGDDTCIARLTIPLWEMQQIFQHQCAEQAITRIELLLDNEAYHAHLPFLHTVLSQAKAAIEIAPEQLPTITRGLWLCYQIVSQPNDESINALTALVNAINQQPTEKLRALGNTIEQHVLKPSNIENTATANDPWSCAETMGSLLSNERCCLM